MRLIPCRVASAVAISIRQVDRDGDQSMRCILLLQRAYAKYVLTLEYSARDPVRPR